MRTALLLLMLVVILGCSPETPSNNPEEVSGQDCSRLEPENPYTEGSGHYAGFEWAEANGAPCGGNSDSFIEGCEEHEAQTEAYESCLQQ